MCDCIFYVEVTIKKYLALKQLMINQRVFIMSVGLILLLTAGKPYIHHIINSNDDIDLPKHISTPGMMHTNTSDKQTAVILQQNQSYQDKGIFQIRMRW